MNRQWGPLALLALFVISCLPVNQALSADLPKKSPIVFAGTLSLTGKYATMGRMQEKGYRLWESEVNARGGLLGRPVNLRITDDESDPAKTTRLYMELVQKKKADLLLSPYSSELTLRVVDLAEKARYPMLISGAASENIWATPRRYIFGVYSTANRYFIGFLEICATRKVMTVSIAGFLDPFSRATAEGAKKWAEKFGMKVVRYSLLDSGGEKTLAAEAAAIAAARPAAVIVAGHFTETVNMRRALEKAGAGTIPFAGSVGPAVPEFLDATGSLAEGVFGASQWEPDERIPYHGSRSFIGNFRKTYREDPSYHAASAYAAMQLFEEAILKTRSVNRETIREHLVSSNTEHRSILGPFRLKDGIQVGHRILIVQWQKGKKEIVWPEKMRTASPVFPR